MGLPKVPTASVEDPINELDAKFANPEGAMEAHH